MASVMDPTGQQFEIASGGVGAVVTEVGAGLRSFTVGGVPYVETHEAGRRPPRGSGSLLAPWPNRVAGGRWTWEGTPQQLALTEPAAGNAIHGLLRHVLWEAEHEAESVRLTAVAPPQPGWPEPVRVAVRYTVGYEGLTVTTVATNLGEWPVPFGLGFHPYLRAGDAETDDSTLRLAATTELPLEAQLPAGLARPLAGADPLRDGRPLRGVSLDSAFGGCEPDPVDGRVRHTLTAPDGSGVALWADPDFRWVQVFTPEDFPGRGRAVAVEPMTCPPDALNSGTDLIVLEPGKAWTGSWGLTPISATA